MSEPKPMKRYTLYAKWTPSWGGNTELIGETDHDKGIDILLLRWSGGRQRGADVYVYDDMSGEIRLVQEATP
jgi:hypothetical protein